VRKYLVAEHAWPDAGVSTSERAETNPQQTPRVARAARAAGIDVLGPRGPLFENMTLSLAYSSQQHLLGEDGFGEDRFRVLLTEQGMQRGGVNRNAYSQPSVNYGRVRGGLLVLALGTELVAVDTLRGGDAAASKILWTENLSDQIGGLQQMHAIVPRAVNQRWGQARYVPEDTFGRRYGTIGPVTEHGVCFQRLHDLHCVDLLTGKTIWTRKNVPLGLDLFGDDELLFAAPVGDGETLVLNAATGELVGKRRIAKLEERMATLGRQVLTWQPVEKGNQLEMRDVEADRVLWSYTFAAGAKASVAREDALGVLQPDGEFSLVRLADGKLLAKERLEVPNSLMGIYLIQSPEGYLLAVNAAARSQRNLSVQPFPNVGDCPLVNGPIYAFDRADGHKLWSQPVNVTQHGLLLSQPSELPVLVLIRQVHRVGPSSVREPKLSIMCIDKRSGRVVYSKDELPGTTVPSCEITGDPAAKTVTIALANRVITLAFTDEQADPQAALPLPRNVATPAVAFQSDSNR
jgi:outer membrane protein assembly factor BamB